MLDSVEVGERPALRWGLNLSAAVFSDARSREEQLTRLAANGVELVRISMPWSWVEGTKGRRDFSFIDRLMDDLDRHKMRPLVEVSNMPEWARPSGTPETFGPTTDEQRAGYAAHCGALASRYAGRVYAYEIWNEANGGTWYPWPDMNNYSKLFVEAYKAIKAADPTAPVITTGMAGYCGYIDPLPWTKDFVRTEAMALADGLGYHPYSNGDGKASGMLLDAAYVRKLLDEAGFSHVPLYMTEAGIATAGRSHVSEAMQATVIDVTADWLATIPGVNCVLWYCDMDSVHKQQADPGSPEGYFGLYRADGTAKPAWTNFTAQLQKRLPAGNVGADWFGASGTTVVPLVSEA